MTEPAVIKCSLGDIDVAALDRLVDRLSWTRPPPLDRYRAQVALLHLIKLMNSGVPVAPPCVSTVDNTR